MLRHVTCFTKCKKFRNLLSVPNRKELLEQERRDERERKRKEERKKRGKAFTDSRIYLHRRKVEVRYQ